MSPKMVIEINKFQYLCILMGLTSLIVIPSMAIANSWVDVQQTTANVSGQWIDVQLTTASFKAGTWTDIQFVLLGINGFDPFTLDITDIVWLIIFFIPIMILAFKLGPLGLVSGMAIMSIVFIFTIDRFMVSGVLNIIGIVIYLYKGGGAQ